LAKAGQFTKIGILLALRETYLFCRNLLGLVLHPFKTIIFIWQEKDLSQAILVFGLPLYLFVAGFIFIKASRFLLGAPSHPWGFWAKLGGILLLLVTFLTGFYLFYWLLKVYRSKKHEI